MRKAIKWRDGATKVILYLRVSTEEQARDAYGLESQEKKCRTFCLKRGWTVVGVFVDKGVSAWADVERPEFHRMMEYLSTHNDVNLVFFDYSRFGRNTRRALDAFEELDNLGVLSIAADNPGIDCKAASGRTARRAELSNAEDFSDKNSEKTSERMKAAFEDGRYCGSAPLGYRNIGTKIKGQPNIVPDEVASPLVRKAFELLETGNYRPTEVLRTVTEMGLRSARQSNKLTLHTFLKMLRNPIYIGQMKSKRWGTQKGLHQAIVDEHVFRNVQLILKGKKRIVAAYKRNNPDYPLRGLLRCSECGKPLTAGQSKGKYPYYHCFNPDCRAVKSRHTAKHRPEREFMALLTHLRPTERTLSELPSAIRRVWQERTVDNAATLRKLRIELQEKRDLQAKLIVKYLNGDKAIVSVFPQMNAKFEDEIATLEARLGDFDVENATFEKWQEFAESMLVDIATAWQRANVEQRQRVQNTLFPEGLFYHPQKGILNSETNVLFNQLGELMSGKISLARPERFELPT